MSRLDVSTHCGRYSVSYIEYSYIAKTQTQFHWQFIRWPFQQGIVHIWATQLSKPSDDSSQVTGRTKGARRRPDTSEVRLLRMKKNHTDYTDHLYQKHHSCLWPSGAR